MEDCIMSHPNGQSFVPVGLRLPRWLAESLRCEAARKGVSLNRLIVDALSGHTDEQTSGTDARAALAPFIGRFSGTHTDASTVSEEFAVEAARRHDADSNCK